MSIVNCTGLPALLTFKPSGNPMRLQPIGNAHVDAVVHTDASSFSEWVSEWVKLISYGPTYNQLSWAIPPGKTEIVRFEIDGPLVFELEWTDKSVSWEKKQAGKWTIDIQKAVDLTMYIKAEIGEYIKQRVGSGPQSVKSIQLKPYLEIACDDELPFQQNRMPISNMYWSPQINIKQLIQNEL